MSLLLAAGITKGLGAALGFRSRRKSAKNTARLANQQKQMAYENNQLELQELNESIRRTELGNTMTRGSATARAAASGVELSGTTSGYLDFMESTQTDEVDWMRKAGESRAAMNLKTGLMQAQSLKYEGKAQERNAYAGLIGDVGSIFAMSGLGTKKPAAAAKPAITG